MNDQGRHKKPVDTGIKDLLGDLFDSPAMDEAVLKAEQRQSPKGSNSSHVSLVCSIQPSADVSTEEGMEVSTHAHGSKQNYIDGSMGGNISGNMEVYTQVSILGSAQSYMDVYKNNNPELWRPFTANQGKILLYLIEGNGLANRNQMSEDTGVSVESIAKTLKSFENRGYIQRSSQKHYAHTSRGFYYKIDVRLFAEFYRQVRGPEVALPVTPNLYTQPSTHVSMHGNNSVRPFAYSSSSITNKPTTIPSSQDDSVKTILTGSVGAYWEGHGLQDRQALRWCEQFDVQPDQMRMQLDWARHDLEINGDIAKVTKDAISWFFGCLRKTGGCYSRPANYKSPVEIRAEMMEMEAERMAEARHRQESASREILFQKILSEPTSVEFKRLYDLATEFSKEVGGVALETSMREVFLNNHPAGEDQ